ncbi:MAG TPA: hypothetical protein VF273_00985 [Pelobium sp.]
MKTINKLNKLSAAPFATKFLRLCWLFATAKDKADLMVYFGLCFCFVGAPVCKQGIYELGEVERV